MARSSEIVVLLSATSASRAARSPACTRAAGHAPAHRAQRALSAFQSGRPNSRSWRSRSNTSRSRLPAPRAAVEMAPRQAHAREARADERDQLDRRDAGLVEQRADHRRGAAGVAVERGVAPVVDRLAVPDPHQGAHLLGGERRAARQRGQLLQLRGHRAELAAGGREQVIGRGVLERHAERRGAAEQPAAGALGRKRLARHGKGPADEVLVLALLGGALHQDDDRLLRRAARGT